MKLAQLATLTSCSFYFFSWKKCFVNVLLTSQIIFENFYTCAHMTACGFRNLLFDLYTHHKSYIKMSSRNWMVKDKLLSPVYNVVSCIFFSSKSLQLTLYVPMEKENAKWSDMCLQQSLDILFHSIYWLHVFLYKIDWHLS